MSAIANLQEAGGMNTDDDDNDDLNGESSDHVDGRSLRRERNRDAVIQALLDIIREGNFEPGGAEIAERAGVSHRSVFRYFDDLGDLVRTAIGVELAASIPLGTIENLGQGPLADRINVLVDSRLRMFDRVHGVATVARVRALTIPEIGEEFAEIADMFRIIMRKHIAPELLLFPENDRELIVDNALLIVSWDSYDFQHRLFRHDNAWIRRSWTTGLLALLTH